MLLRTRLSPALAGGISTTRFSLSFSARQQRQRLRFMSCVTVSLDPSRASLAELKKAAVDGVEEWLTLDRPSDQSPTARQSKNSVVILVSKSLAPMLDDTNFLSRIISSTGITDAESRELSVLSGAVDEVPRYDRRLDSFCSSEGVSVLCGNVDRVLPHLWTAGLASQAGTQPSLEFQPPRNRYTGPLRVTVPLANTMFSNGRPYALSVSRWTTQPGQLPQFVEKKDKTNQVVVFPKDDMKFRDKSLSTTTCALVPVTEPRKIVAGLGNILRQVEIDGPAPASRELEAIIPTLVQKRATRSPDHPGPVGVWALIMPPKYVEEKLPLVKPVDWKNYHASDELRLVKELGSRMDMILAGGGQLRKVLSGGGGWGQKQGLLSLDPQTTLHTPEHEDLESFINSFKGQGGGIAPPGSYVQFLMEAVYPSSPSDDSSSPQTPRKWDPADDASESPTVVLGTPGAAPLAVSPAVSDMWPSLFGAVSSEGVYLESREDGAEEGATKGEVVVTTKIDAPRSYMVSTARFRDEMGAKI